MEKMFSEGELEAISKALADTSEGLTGSEIGHILASLKIEYPTPGITKWKRLYNAFAKRQAYAQNRMGILEFIRNSMRPERFVKKHERFEKLRANLNQALAFSGIAVIASGNLEAVDRVDTINEASKRANALRTDLMSRGVHPDVLRFCRDELVADNYFHAVLEATKSIADKIRGKTGRTEDGAPLVDVALCGNSPLLAINSLTTESEKNEQRGFSNLVKGVFGMFRNTTAHAPRVLWQMTKEDAEDLLSIASLIHRRLDACNNLK